MNHLGTKTLQIINDSEKLIQIERSISQVIRSEPKSALIRDLILIKTAEWIAVPTLSFPNFNLILEYQSQTQLNTDNKNLYGVILPIFGIPFSVCEVPLSSEGIQEFYSILGASPFSPVLFSGDQKPNWMIICMESEFYIIVGTFETVEHLLGCTYAEAFRHFRTFINGFNRSESASPLSQRFYTYYSFVNSQLEKYQQASTGTELLLTLNDDDLIKAVIG
ncbi:hypothetical protein [Leptolyngbya sp. FACHB-711]|uniref:hypothetical protein n=2 Tax=Leptolyngbya TaxID=47251 RepID=UPI001683F2E4|nr:hypothetical protein [Leptolyngbya sp. FACHB-711]MBD1853731.1 hypothetical protein [Cyanobacteria bacterium FACHB-502]MBD2026086.1 hypothetical protein [Leptolyngbya sp. FACHB-711]